MKKGLRAAGLAALTVATLGAAPLRADDLAGATARVASLEMRVAGFLDSFGRSSSAPVVQTQSAATFAELSLRIDTAEAQMRQLTGEVERLSYQVRQLEERMKRFSDDADMHSQEGAGTARPKANPAGPTRRSELSEPQPGPQAALSGDALRPGTEPSRPGGDARPLPPQVEAPPQAHAAAPSVAGQPSPAGPGAPPRDLGQLAVPADPAGSATGRPLKLGVPQGAEVAGPGAPVGPAPGPQAAPGGQTLVMAPTATAKDEYDLAYGYILRGDYDMADRSLRQFLTAYPTDRLAGNAQFWLGESLFRRGRYRDAADAFLKGYTTYADGAKAPDSLARLGMALRALNENEAACATFAEFGRKFPRASADLKRQVQTDQKRANC